MNSPSPLGWSRVTARKEFLASEQARPFLQMLCQLKEQKCLATTVLRCDEPLRERFGIERLRIIHEILTVYFPLDLPEDFRSVSRSVTPPLMNNGKPGYDFNYGDPMGGFLFRSHGLLEGEVENKGQPARRMVYILGGTTPCELPRELG
ncbi:hypothetical protein BJX70DRAFT_365529 [Aspergillus crustosus]